MADDDKAKSAAERLKAAKQEAEDAEIVSGEDSRPAETGAETATEAGADAETAKTPWEGAKPDDAAAETTPADGDAAEEVAEDLAAESADGAETHPDDAETVAEDLAAESGETAGDAPGATEEPPASEPVREDPPAAAHAPDAGEEHEGRTLAGMVLQWLFILVIGATAALWIGPKIAPHLPGWAEPAAKFLTPGANRAEEALAELRASHETAVAELSARMDAAEARLRDETKSSEAARNAMTASLESRIAAAEEAKVDTSSFEDAVDTLAGRVTSAEAALAGMRAEVEALSGFSGGSEAPSAETLERVAAFGAAVEGLRGEVEALSQATAQIDGLAAKGDLTALADRVAALEEGEAATAGAAAEADQIRRAANLNAALTEIGRALTSGQAFDVPLGTVENISGVAAPPALAEVAAAGAPTTEELTSSFQAAARDGYAAAMEAEAGEGAASKAIAGVLGRLGGRPAYEAEGDDAGAVLSRVEARLKEGDAETALAEARTLPTPAAEAMAGWIARLEGAAAARTALEDYRAQLATN